MSANQPAEILAAGMVSAVGLTASATAAAIRAGISRVRFSDLRDKKFEPLLTGFLDDVFLPPLADAPTGAPHPAPERYQRMLRLATRALQEAAGHPAHPLPLVLALPEARPETAVFPGTRFLELLANQSQVPLDSRRSEIICQGRAGGLIALRNARRLLEGGHVPRVLVGGVDTYRELPLLAALEEERRLHVEGLSDGFVPGEGAAFLQLTLPGAGLRDGLSPLASLTSTGVGHEEGHLYSDRPYLGEGLSRAFQELFLSRSTSMRRIRRVYTGLNGESFWAKEWGVACLRHSQHFEQELRIEHPIQCTGDPGAALGPMMVALAAQGLQKGYRESPCLVWCSSDREERAAVLVEALSTHEFRGNPRSARS